MTRKEIREGRAKLGLSQSQLAQRIGVPIGTVRGWEYGRRKPDGAALTLLRQAFDPRIWQVLLIEDATEKLVGIAGTFRREGMANECAVQQKPDPGVRVEVQELELK